jgi:hypothetical protein
LGISNGCGVSAAPMLRGVRFPLLGVVADLLEQPERFEALNLRTIPVASLLWVEVTLVAGGSLQRISSCSDGTADSAVLALQAVGAGAVQVNRGQGRLGDVHGGGAVVVEA